MKVGRLLDGPTLEAFDRALCQRAHDVRGCLATPGVSSDEVRSQFEEVGLRPSAEALTWWTYWNLAPNCPHRDVLPDWQFVAIDASFRAARWYRAQAEQLAQELNPPRDPEAAWSRRWIPLLTIRSGGTVVMDHGSDEGGPTALRAVWPDTVWAPDHAPELSPSLGEMIARATVWMEQGTCHYDRDRRTWWPIEAWARRSFVVADRFALG